MTPRHTFTHTEHHRLEPATPSPFTPTPLVTAAPGTTSIPVATVLIGYPIAAASRQVSPQFRHLSGRRGNARFARSGLKINGF